MPVVVLAGGMGTRLREETERVPKPLVEIGERPILWHIMKLYGHHGARRFLVCLGYKSWQIKEFFLRYHEQSADLTVHIGSDEPPTFHDQRGRARTGRSRSPRPGLTTGTGGRLHRVRQYIDTDTFMFTYGDGIGRVDIEALLDFHRSHDRIGTVTGVHPSSRYGEMRVEDGIVDRVQREADDPGGLRQRRLLRLPARDLRLPDRRARADLRAGAAAQRSPATASSPSTATRTSGWGWTPTASSPSSTACGRAAKRPGRCGSAE